MVIMHRLPVEEIDCVNNMSKTTCLLGLQIVCQCGADKYFMTDVSWEIYVHTSATLWPIIDNMRDANWAICGVALKHSR